MFFAKAFYIRKCLPLDLVSSHFWGCRHFPRPLRAKRPQGGDPARAAPSHQAHGASLMHVVLLVHRRHEISTLTGVKLISRLRRGPVLCLMLMKLSGRGQSWGGKHFCPRRVFPGPKLFLTVLVLCFVASTGSNPIFLLFRGPAGFPQRSQTCKGICGQKPSLGESLVPKLN